MRQCEVVTLGQLCPTASLHMRGAQQGESWCLCKSLGRREVAKGVSSSWAAALAQTAGREAGLSQHPQHPHACCPRASVHWLEGVRKKKIFEKMHLQKAVVAWFVTSQR